MKNYLIILFSLTLFSTATFAKDEKAEKENKKRIEKEEQHYQKELRKNAGSSLPYWHHAINLAEIKSECITAKDFYIKAIKIDSTNGLLQKDYGKYLYDKLREYDDANEVFIKAKKYLPTDAEIVKYQDNLKIIFDNRNRENKLRDIGISNSTIIDTTVNFATITKFDSLFFILADSNNYNSYKKLLSRFLKDDNSLTPAEMYMLIVGYSRQKTYNSFDYNAISELRMQSDLDTAISKGNLIINTNPLNPSLNKEMMYFYRLKKDDAMANKFLNRVHQYFNGMMYGADGTCKRPYITLWAKEEYSFLTYLGYEPTEFHSMGSCANLMSEIVEVKKPNSKASKDIHFDMQLIYLMTTGK